MQVRIRETGAVMYEGEFRALHPNTSFPARISEQLLNDMGADVVFEGPQAQPTRYQVGFRDGVEQINGKWYTKYSVSDIDDEAKAAVDSAQADAIRASRNEKLKDSDWTQVADAPGDKAAWATYRQALRDISSQDGFPWTVIWPDHPTV